MRFADTSGGGDTTLTRVWSACACTCRVRRRPHGSWERRARTSAAPRMGPGAPLPCSSTARRALPVVLARAIGAVPCRLGALLEVADGHVAWRGKCSTVVQCSTVRCSAAAAAQCARGMVDGHIVWCAGGCAVSILGRAARPHRATQRLVPRVQRGAARSLERLSQGPRAASCGAAKAARLLFWTCGGHRTRPWRCWTGRPSRGRTPRRCSRASAARSRSDPRSTCVETKAGCGPPAPTQAAGWPRLAGAWGSLGRGLALSEASGALAGRRLSRLAFDMARHCAGFFFAFTARYCGRLSAMSLWMPRSVALSLVATGTKPSVLRSK